MSEAFVEAEIPVVDGAASSSAVPHVPARQAAVHTRHASEPSGAGAAGRVLVIDDQADMTNMMQLMLSRRGYCVATASSARRGIETALDFCPDLVISDIGMPGMDGCAMMRALRVEKKLPPFKAIALTGFGLAADQEHARDAGFDFCLVKPVEFSTFFACVEEMLNQRSGETTEDRAAASCLHTALEPRPAFDSGPDTGLDCARLTATSSRLAASALSATPATSAKR